MKAQRDLRVFRDRAFLISIERVKRVVVETGLVGGAETRRLLHREGRGAGSVSRIHHCEVLGGGGTGSGESSDVVVGWDLTIDVTAAGGQIPEEYKRSGYSTAARDGVPGNRDLAGVLVIAVVCIAAVGGNGRGPSPAAVRVTVLAVIGLHIRHEFRAEGQ